MPHKKNPDIFELIRGKCNKVQALPYELSLLTNNLPSGYHRDAQLLKEGLFPALEMLKSCLEMAVYSIKEIEVNVNILEDEKYDHLFTVDAINELVTSGISFRDAYKIIGKQIDDGSFISPKATKHTHEGSINNLCLNEVIAKMNEVLET